MLGAHSLGLAFACLAQGHAGPTHNGLEDCSGLMRVGLCECGPEALDTGLIAALLKPSHTSCVTGLAGGNPGVSFHGNKAFYYITSSRGALGTFPLSRYHKNSTPSSNGGADRQGGVESLSSPARLTYPSPTVHESIPLLHNFAERGHYQHFFMPFNLLSK